MSNDSTNTPVEADTQTQPTGSQIIEARFEAVKVATAVAERVLLHSYERQVIVQACVLALQTLKQEHERVLIQEAEDANDAEYSTDSSPLSEGEDDDIQPEPEESEEG